MDEKITSPIKAIRAKCLDCCCESYQEVKECTVKKCPLWDFRFGKNPFRKQMSEEQRKAAGERLKNARNKINDTDEDIEY